MNSKQPGAIHYNEQRERALIAKVVEERRRQAMTLATQGVKRPGVRYHGDKLLMPQVFYSLDGEEIAAYDVEVHTDELFQEAAGAQSSPDTALDNIQRPDRSTRPRYVYNESMRQDIVTQYDMVHYHDEANIEATECSKRSLPKDVNEAVACSTALHVLPAKKNRKTCMDKVTPIVQSQLASEKRQPLPSHCSLCDSGVATWFSAQSQSTFPRQKTSCRREKRRVDSKSSSEKSVRGMSPDTKMESRGIGDTNTWHTDKSAGKFTNRTSKSIDDTSSLFPLPAVVVSYALIFRSFVVTCVDDVLEGVHEWCDEDRDDNDDDDDDDDTGDDTVDCETLATRSTTLFDLVNNEDSACLVISSRIFARKLLTRNR